MILGPLVSLLLSDSNYRYIVTDERTNDGYCSDGHSFFRNFFWSDYKENKFFCGFPYFLVFFFIEPLLLASPLPKWLGLNFDRHKPKRRKSNILISSCEAWGFLVTMKASFLKLSISSNKYMFNLNSETVWLQYWLTGKIKHFIATKNAF